MKLFELAYTCRLYGVFSNYDDTYRRFRDTTPAFDIFNHLHRKALLKWLNSWGCRQFALNFHDKASEHLRNWGEENLTRLPPAGVSLLDLTDINFVNAGTLYASLRDLQASVHQCKGNSYSVTFGPTGAAKTLFALREQVFPPWDKSIRVHHGYDDSKESYIEFLQLVRHELQEVVTDAEAHGVVASNIPNTLNRPFSSLPKLVDEYNWVTITRGCKPPRLEEINNWLRWTRPVDPTPDNTT